MMQKDFPIYGGVTWMRNYKSGKIRRTDRKEESRLVHCHEQIPDVCWSILINKSFNQTVKIRLPGQKNCIFKCCLWWFRYSQKHMLTMCFTIGLPTGILNFLTRTHTPAHNWFKFPQMTHRDLHDYIPMWKIHKNIYYTHTFLTSSCEFVSPRNQEHFVLLDNSSCRVTQLDCGVPQGLFFELSSNTLVSVKAFEVCASCEFDKSARWRVEWFLQWLMGQ